MCVCLAVCCAHSWPPKWKVLSPQCLMQTAGMFDFVCAVIKLSAMKRNPRVPLVLCLWIFYSLFTFHIMFFCDLTSSTGTSVEYDHVYFWVRWSAGYYVWFMKKQSPNNLLSLFIFICSLQLLGRGNTPSVVCCCHYQLNLSLMKPHIMRL